MQYAELKLKWIFILLNVNVCKKPPLQMLSINLTLVNRFYKPFYDE